MNSCTVWWRFTADINFHFAASLLIPALISDLHKMSLTLDFPFYFGFRYLRRSPYSLRGAIIFWGIITLWNLNSLVISNWGVFIFFPNIYGDLVQLFSWEFWEIFQPATLLKTKLWHRFFLANFASFSAWNFIKNENAT